MRARRGRRFPPSASGASSSSPGIVAFFETHLPRTSNAAIAPRLDLAVVRFAVVVLLLAGCANKGPSKSELRRVTAEILTSAQTITAHKSEITIRPETQPVKAGEAPRGAVDNVYVPLADSSQSKALEQSLADIARRHKLTTTETNSRGAITVDFAFNGKRTHSIHIIPPAQIRAATSVSGAFPRLAIIVDDLGHDRAAAQQLLALPFPLTVSVIPHLPFSSDVAEEAFRRGDQVLLHLPMESESEAKPENVELRVGMNSGQVQTALAGMLETVPHAVGVNNHQGSRATADPALMRELMPALRQRQLFFIDSRTTKETIAYDAAESAGVRAASRKVFLDDTPTREAVRAQLNLAARDAARDGFAIAIGHPHPATVAALAETLPELQAHGIRLVFASDVVQ